ncbi:tropinone reductase [Canna indica]|uniref:Tropinone reductase n=1 Tax=Canna indica TaxID=4628 RepID=A0AAQ3KYC9_9LILI|nr:tropinone reductase [Canna indica]
MEGWSLKGNTALVTGGSKGIGHAIVEELARFGAAVHTCARNGAELEKCVEEWEAMGLKVTASACDVSSPAEREKLMERVESIFHGKLNILVNNAGMAIVKPTVEQTHQDYKLQMGTNLDSAFHLSQLAHPLLKVSGRGTIVFNSSILGFVSYPNVAVYCATKGAMNQLTRSLACEWAKDGIRTNCVAPGFIRTPASQSVLCFLQVFFLIFMCKSHIYLRFCLICLNACCMKLAEDEENMTKEARRIPLGRFGEAKEVAAAVVFLCLPASSYVNGEILVVDGGRNSNGGV